MSFILIYVSDHKNPNPLCILMHIPFMTFCFISIYGVFGIYSPELTKFIISTSHLKDTDSPIRTLTPLKWFPSLPCFGTILPVCWVFFLPTDKTLLQSFCKNICLAWITNWCLPYKCFLKCFLFNEENYNHHIYTSSPPSHPTYSSPNSPILPTLILFFP